jgi:hypothetical protein
MVKSTSIIIFDAIYEEEGPGFVDNLQGIFALAV